MRNPICPVHIAERIKASATGSGDHWLAESPRRREILWFLQWASLQHGGLDAFAHQLVEKLPARFQPAALTVQTPDASGLYSLPQCLTVWRELARPMEVLRSNIHSEFGRREARERAWDRISQAPTTISFLDLQHFLTDQMTPRDAEGNDPRAVALRTAVQKYNRPWMVNWFARQAVEKLPDQLQWFCLPDGTLMLSRSFRAVRRDLEATLREFMERHAQETAATIAETTVTKTVRRELEFALASGVPVPIIGESRRGKSKSVANWCDMFPGRARLVTVPESNNELDFMRAHADALGIAYSHTTTTLTLRDQVEFVIKHSGLAVIYDEAHYLVPISYNKATPPRRLNWVRAKLVDRDVPTAFFATPQSYRQSLAKYAEETGYRIEQWLGRVAPAVILSDKIPFDEIVAVARSKFPELSQAQLEELADRVVVSNGNLKSLELAGKRARFLAGERGHAAPTFEDLVDASNEMMSSAPRVVSDHSPRPEPAPDSGRVAGAAVPVPARGSRPATPLQPAGRAPISRRQTRPVEAVAPVLSGP
jgi:hypothetical protein